MPVVGEFHTFFWETSDTNATPVATTPTGGYPPWQAGVIQPGVVLGSGFGGLVPWWERLADRVSWFWMVFRRTRRLDRTQRVVLLRTVETLEHPAYPLARQAVRKTARTLGFNRPESWKALSQELKGDQGRAENAFRHLEACRLVRENLISSTITNPMCHLLVELAYHAYTIDPR